MTKPTKMRAKFHKKKFKSFLNDYKIDELNYLLKELEFGMDIVSNTIFLNSEINIDSLYETIARFNFLERCNSSSKSITLNVSSFGGDVYAMFGIHDYMRTCNVPINTVCVGPAMSAAALLLASGTGIRQMTENSTVMFHQLSSQMEGKTGQVMSNASHMKLLQIRTDELLAKYTKKPKTFWEKETKEDLYLTAKDCINYGVVDKIIPLK